MIETRKYSDLRERGHLLLAKLLQKFLNHIEFSLYLVLELRI